ncbi:hypothetical protein MVEN_00766900 [Mycena venus]|uniref:Uncharacterized protein n=1 Tax=Mycena venus TaxID=2733690 RepID=A0A8H7D679_9AGAR|nr:hypothetical protein MVEN_00766900 [Mycena venus]
MWTGVSTASAEIPRSFRVPPFPLATVEELEPNPEISADPEPDGDADIFEPPTVEYREIPPSFRFPPFPLATAEEQELGPKISAAPETTSDTSVLEPRALDYRAYERLPQPSVDILTQVARSLPELLPDPETESGSIFEDKSHDDYADISTSSTPPITSTRSLEMLVADRNYDEALRVLDALLEVGTSIPPSFAYEEAAIWAVRAPANTASEMDDQIEKFRKWFSLIPRADRSSPRRFSRLRDRIMLSPLNSLRLIMEFGLIAAEKGYARSTHHRVTTLVCMYGDPDVTLQYIDELRGRNRMFLEQSSQRAYVDKLDNKLRVDIVGVAVRTLANAGRFDHAVQLIPDPTETHFHLTPYTYHYLVHKMEATRDPRYVPHINFVKQHKSEARHRSFGLTKMEKPHLALAIRCLANTGQFNLAVGLLPKLQEAEAGLLTEALDFLLARLRESEDDHHSIFFDRISQLREATQSTPVIPDSTIPSSDTPETNHSQPIFGPTEYRRAIEALTKAWCLEEAVALMPAYHQTNTGHRKTLYNVLLWKLKISYNPKYEPYMSQIKQMREHTVQLAARAKVMRRVASEAEVSAKDDPREARLAERSEADAARHLEDFSGEDILMASSVSSSRPPQRVGFSLAASLRALRKAFRDRLPSGTPHPLTIVRFLEVYLASERTRAIPLLRNLALSRGAGYSLSYIFAEMLFHARRGNPDLVIQTFVTHFFIVGLPRDELLVRLRTMERDPAAEALWAATPAMKLFPYPMHAAVVWRALLELTHDERALEALYVKLLKFADLRSPQSSVLQAGIPLLHPPPAWQTGVAASAFTPFVRRMCRAFGTERGGLILKDMVRLGIQPNIYQLTELAMEYSRVGDVRRTLLVLDQVENAAKAWESVDAPDSEQSDDADDEVARRRRAQRNHLLPRVDQVFYVAVVRGLLLSKRYAEARLVEQRMSKRYGYVAGKSQHLDELYEDLRVAEEGKKIPPREGHISAADSPKYKALSDNSQSHRVVALTALDLGPEPPSSAGV